jgi:hypothetical protein
MFRNYLDPFLQRGWIAAADMRLARRQRPQHKASGLFAGEQNLTQFLLQRGFFARPAAPEAKH